MDKIIGYILHLILRFIVITLVIMFAPLLLALILINCYVFPAHCGEAKFLIGVFGPLVFATWFAGFALYSENKNDMSAIEDGKGQGRACLLGVYFVVVGYIGVLVSTMNSLEGNASLWAMVLGLFSPAILYNIWKAKTSPDGEYGGEGGESDEGGEGGESDEEAPSLTAGEPERPRRLWLARGHFTNPTPSWRCRRRI